MRVVVTGGSGKAGRWLVRHLRESGYDVLNVDAQHDGSSHGLCLVTDHRPVYPTTRLPVYSNSTARHKYQLATVR